MLIGTHRLIGKDVEFKDLGLLIIDEEQKFGVGAKEKLKELKVNWVVIDKTRDKRYEIRDTILKAQKKWEDENYAVYRI